MSDPAEEMRQSILDAYGVTLEEVEELDAALGGPESRERERQFIAELPGRMNEARDHVNEALAGILPEGMRFEWELPEEEA
jgi:hypothetical protein